MVQVSSMQGNAQNLETCNARQSASSSRTPPTKRAISGLLAARCCRLTVEFEVMPRSAIRPMRAGSANRPITLPVLKEYSALVALLLSPTLHNNESFEHLPNDLKGVRDAFMKAANICRAQLLRQCSISKPSYLSLEPSDCVDASPQWRIAKRQEHVGPVVVGGVGSQVCKQDSVDERRHIVVVIRVGSLPSVVLHSRPT